MDQADKKKELEQASPVPPMNVQEVQGVVTEFIAQLIDPALGEAGLDKITRWVITDPTDFEAVRKRFKEFREELANYGWDVNKLNAAHSIKQSTDPNEGTQELQNQIDELFSQVTDLRQEKRQQTIANVGHDAHYGNRYDTLLETGQQEFVFDGTPSQFAAAVTTFDVRGYHEDSTPRYHLQGSFGRQDEIRNSNAVNHVEVAFTLKGCKGRGFITAQTTPQGQSMLVIFVNKGYEQEVKLCLLRCWAELHSELQRQGWVETDSTQASRNGRPGRKQDPMYLAVAVAIDAGLMTNRQGVDYLMDKHEKTHDAAKSGLKRAREKLFGGN